MDEDKSFIRVKVEQLLLSNVGFAVVLKAVGDPRSLPIFIGEAEAQSIAMWLNEVKVPRPLTHDLLKNILDQLECRLQRIEVCDLRDDTFYARLIIDRGDEMMEVDARPSDAIALALRFRAPIFVAVDVMDRAGRVLEEATEAAAKGTPEPQHEKSVPHAQSKPLSALETLKLELEKAVREERYEDAASLRDRISGLERKPPEN